MKINVERYLEEKLVSLLMVEGGPIHVSQTLIENSFPEEAGRYHQIWANPSTWSRKFRKLRAKADSSLMFTPHRTLKNGVREWTVTLKSSSEGRPAGETASPQQPTT